MDRKAFVARLAGTLLAAPFIGFAQPAARVPRIGYLTLSASANESPSSAVPFLEGLRELGYESGRVVIVFRGAAGRAELLSERARELLDLNPDVIVAYGGLDVQAVLAMTQSIPVVMIYVPDPVGRGFVESLARPGRNVTGLTTLSSELTAKRLQLLGEVRPGLTRVAILWDLGLGSPDSVGSPYPSYEQSAQLLGIRTLALPVRESGDFDAAFQAARREDVGAVMLGPDTGLLRTHLTRIAQLGVRYRLPTSADRDIYVRGGVLMAYGPDVADLTRRAATYVDKILKGSKAAELPIEQPTKFEFVINLKTAKALGITIPQSLLLRADEVIQ